MTIIIDLSKCDLCGNCVAACPANAITRKGDLIAIDESLCTLCKRCIDVCPLEAISEEIGDERGTELIQPIPQNLEIITAEPIPVQEKSRRPIFGKEAIIIVLRLFDGLANLLNKDITTPGDDYINKRRNQSHPNDKSNRHRRQNRGHSRRK